MELLITDINSEPLFLTRNNTQIKVTMVKISNHRYSITKLPINCYNDDIAEINRIKNVEMDKVSGYKLNGDIINNLKLFKGDK